jgi:uncharacterized MAPEG superfamily protein
MSASQTFAACASILLGKLAFIGMSTAMARGLTRVFKNPEDGPFWDSEFMRKFAPFAPKGALIEVEGAKSEVVERLKRTHQNALENILPWAALSSLFLTFCNPTATQVKYCFVGFTVARVVHSVAYLTRLGHVRFFAFFYGAVVMLYEASQVYGVTKTALFK